MNGPDIQMCEGCDKAPATTFDSEGIPLCKTCIDLPSEAGSVSDAPKSDAAPGASSENPSPSVSDSNAVQTEELGGKDQPSTKTEGAS